MKHKTLYKMLLTALFAALTAIGAFLKIPVGTVSFTLQVFFTCMAGVLLGPYWGALSQFLYVALGLIGLPIFTAGGGLMYVAVPTFGFLLGLIPMAFIVGLLSRKGLSRLPWLWLRLAIACVIGLVVLYIVGLPYLYFSLGGAWSISKTFVSGCFIFLPYDALKIVCVVLLGVRLLPILQRFEA